MSSKFGDGILLAIPEKGFEFFSFYKQWIFFRTLSTGVLLKLAIAAAC